MKLSEAVLRRPESDLGRLPVQLDLHAISLMEGFRAALSVAAIVALGEYVGRPSLMEAALGALLTCLADAGGPVRRRLPAMVTFAVVGALLTAGFGLSRAFPLWVVIPLACFGLVCTGFARVWGSSAMQVGNLSSVVLILAVYRPMDWAQAGEYATAFFGGSVWALLLTLLVWRLHPFGPARAAIAECYRQLALMARETRGLVQRGADVRAWEAHARAHRRAVRDGIERAREAVKNTVRWRGSTSPRLAQGLVRLETADQIFGVFIALTELLEQERDPALLEAAAQVLRLAAPCLQVLGAASRADEVLREGRLDPALDRMQAAGARDARLRAIVDRLAERLRIAGVMSGPTGLSPDEPLQSEARVPWTQRLIDPLRANLDWESASLRHAARTAFVAVPAFALTLPHYRGYEHWLTITLVLTMQPFFALTWQRAVERVAGTVLGGVFAALLAIVCTTPFSIAVAMFPLAMIAFALRQVSFGAFIAGITPLVVLLSELGRLGTSELTIAAIRALYTAVGGLFAVAGVVLLWPSWEPDRLRDELKAAIAAHARYAEAVMALRTGGAPPDTVEAARRAAGLASNNLETSISRALLEPGQGPGLTGAGPDRIEAAMLVDAALRRIAGRLAALQLVVGTPDGMGAEDWDAWRRWIANALEGLQQSPAMAPPRPDAAPVESLARIGRQIELMQGALARLAA
jgi:uncharacterized membrane protein YccC